MSTTLKKYPRKNCQDISITGCDYQKKEKSMNKPLKPSLHGLVVDNKTEANDIVPHMQLLGFEAIGHVIRKDNEHHHVFIHEKIGLCEITTYNHKIGGINLDVNYRFLKSRDFNKDFMHGSWCSSIGVPSGYGGAIKVGTLGVTDLGGLVAEMKKSGTFIFPWVANELMLSDDCMSQEEREQNPEVKGNNAVTQWFVAHRMQPRHQELVGSFSTQFHSIEHATLWDWDDHINWNLKDGKIAHGDKSFYAICKKFINEDLSTTSPLVDKSFLYHTTGLGQNFSHLMAVIRDPLKKQFLWDCLEHLPPELQTRLLTQNDVMGYNPVLITAHFSHHMDSQVADNNLVYFKRLLTVPGIECNFVNPRNSLLDCLSYGGELLRMSSSGHYIHAVHEAGLQIPMIFHDKKFPYSSSEKVMQTALEQGIAKYMQQDVYTLLNAHHLNATLTSRLEPNDNQLNCTARKASKI